jgi:hypothetical protein
LGETLENAHDASIRSEEVLSQGASVLSGIEDIRIPEVDFKKVFFLISIIETTN